MRVSRFVFCFLPFFCLALPVHADKPRAPDQIPGTTRVSAERAAELILTLPDLVVIDSRREVEHAKGHIEGAVSLLDSEMTEQKLARVVPEKTRPLLFYCNGARCLRSTNACRKAVTWGYREIFWLRGGWTEWKEKGLPVSK